MGSGVGMSPRGRMTREDERERECPISIRRKLLRDDVASVDGVDYPHSPPPRVDAVFAGVAQNSSPPKSPSGSKYPAGVGVLRPRSSSILSLSPFTVSLTPWGTNLPRSYWL